MRKILVWIFFIFYIQNIAYAWNAIGHRSIAAIAWQNLDAYAKKQFIQDNLYCVNFDMDTDFIAASVWMDEIKSLSIHWYDSFHYMDVPFTQDNTLLPKYVETNDAVHAISIAKNIIRQNKVSKIDKCIAWRILIHVIGDIHQPLHSATKVSKECPDGDKGGNLFIIDNTYNAHNLHEYWDKAGGVFASDSLKPTIISNILQKEMSCKNIEYLNNDPKLWAQESHYIAVNFGYPKAHGFDLLYQKQVKSISLQQILKAGCRMSRLINEMTSAKPSLRLRSGSR